VKRSALFTRRGPLPGDSRRPRGHFDRRRSFGLISLDIVACNRAGEFDPKRVIGTPDRAALSDIIPSNLKHKFVRDGGSAHTGDFRAPVREVAQNAGAV
jgi:hypothetical protein